MGESKTLPITWRSDSTTEEYERARVGRVFNHRRPDRFPVAVVEAENEDHIQQAVQIAQRRNLRVSIRSGGHSWAAWSVRDNAILIDLGNYKQIDVDETTGIVKVSPSTTGHQLNTVLKEKGLMFPGGHCPDVGLGGFLLQGGMGWVCRSWGWACENVKAIDVVTAAGKKLHCNSTENKDLFWAARGAGPGFPAIVTRFHIQTRPLPTHVHTSTYIFPKTLFHSALNWAISLAPSYDSDTEIVCVGRYLPTYKDSIIIIGLTTFKSSPSAATHALQAAESSLPPGWLEKSFNTPTSLQEQYADQALANPAGHRYCTDNAYLSNDADVAAVLEESFTNLPSRKSFTLWFAMAPVSRRPLPDMALSLHSDHYLAIYSVWETPEADAECQAWVRRVMDDMQPHAVGRYLGDSDFQVRSGKYWSRDNGERLRGVRGVWDPEGRVCGYLDRGDGSGVGGLRNEL